jgi:ABC-type antimicrobial peptide transport system permease subunit
MSDIRLAWRSLLRTPGASVAAVLTVTLGIGVNLALFSVLDRLMFRPLPYHEPDRLVQPHGAVFRGPRAHVLLPHALARELRERASSFEDVAYAGIGRRREPGRAAGSAAGLLAAWWAAQFAQSLVIDMNVHNPARFILVGLLFALAASLAALLPVRRTARTSPGDILRSN